MVGCDGELTSKLICVARWPDHPSPAACSFSPLSPGNVTHRRWVSTCRLYLCGREQLPPYKELEASQLCCWVIVDKNLVRGEERLDGLESLVLGWTHCPPAEADRQELERTAS